MNIFRRLVLVLIITGIIVTPAIHSMHLRTCYNHPSTRYLFVGGFGPGNHSSIQNAIDNASDGDIIYVYKGTYYEHLVVDKSVIFMGESRDETIVHGSNSGDKACFSVEKEQVEIYNFTIMWADWEYHEPGIRIYADDVIVKDCNITHHDKGIILFYSAQNCTIKDNIFYTIFEGIFLWSPGSHYHRIINNTITNCGFGIKSFSSRHNVIRDNTINNAGSTGLLFDNSDENRLVNNTVQGCSRGIFLTMNSENNVIYHNNFLNNIDQVVSDGVNTWDDGIGKGNYWDDYKGIDTNDDGIGDSPYSINHQNKDNFPGMMKDFWKASSNFSLEIIGPNEAMINQEIPYSVSVNGGVAPFTYHWDFGDNRTSMDKTTNHQYEHPGEYTISLGVTDALNRIVSSSIDIRVYPLDQQPPRITIINPKPGWYMNTNLLIPSRIPLVVAFGSLPVDLLVEDAETRVTQLDVTIDDIFQYSSAEPSFHYEVNLPFGSYHLQAEAKDFAGNNAQWSIRLLIV